MFTGIRKKKNINKLNFSRSFLFDTEVITNRNHEHAYHVDNVNERRKKNYNNQKIR